MRKLQHGFFIKSFTADPSRGLVIAIFPSGEWLRISVLGDWCFVKNSRFGWGGRELYSERGQRNMEVARRLQQLTESHLEVPRTNPIVHGFLAGLATCASAKEAEHLLRDTYTEVLASEH